MRGPGAYLELSLGAMVAKASLAQSNMLALFLGILPSILVMMDTSLWDVPVRISGRPHLYSTSILLKGVFAYILCRRSSLPFLFHSAFA